jgi:hypothetical protein
MMDVLLFPFLFSDGEIKKVFLDQSFRNYLTDELLATPEQADLDECKSLITLAIKGIDRQLSDYGFGRNLIFVSVKGIDRKISVWVFDRFREKKRMNTPVKNKNPPSNISFAVCLLSMMIISIKPYKNKTYYSVLFNIFFSRSKRPLLPDRSDRAAVRRVRRDHVEQVRGPLRIRRVERQRLEGGVLLSIHQKQSSKNMQWY